MNARKVREQQYRRLMATGLGISVAIHGAVLGLSSFSVDGATSGDPVAPDVQTEASFEVPALELVTLEQPSAPTKELTPAPAQAASRVAESPAPSAASPLAKLENQIALSMRHDFTTQRSVSDWALEPIQFEGDLNGGDDEENDSGAHRHSGGRSWWEGLGIALGIGGGGHCPVGTGGPEPYVSR